MLLTNRAMPLLRRNAHLSILIGALALLSLACGERSPAAIPNPVLVTKPADPPAPLGSLEPVRTLQRTTSQFNNLLSGDEYEVAQLDGGDGALEFVLENLTDGTLRYLSFGDCAEPQFGAALQQRSRSRLRWRKVDLGYCGTYQQVCELGPREQRSVFVPLPAGEAPLRVSLAVQAEGEQGFSHVITGEWLR